MKKFVLSSLVFLLVGSCGSLIGGIAHADTLTPTQAAALQQSLDAVQAEFANLQLQVAEQVPAPTVVATPADPAAQEVATVGAALQSLTTALGQLNQTIAANPTALTSDNKVALQSVLGSVTASLMAMNQMLAGGSAVPVAIVAAAPALQTPTVAVGPSASPVQASVQVAPNADNSAVAAATGNGAAPQTAQISEHVPLNRGWMIAFGVIALLLIAFFVWRSRKSSKRNASHKPSNQPTVVASMSSKTNAPVAPKAVMPMPTNQQTQADMKAAIQRDMPRSPMSSVVAPSRPGNS